MVSAPSSTIDEELPSRGGYKIKRHNSLRRVLDALRGAALRADSGPMDSGISESLLRGQEAHRMTAVCIEK